MRLSLAGLAAVVLAALFTAGCTSTTERADQHIAQDEWMKAVIEYRRALARNPGDVELRSRLRQTEQRAADFYYQRGQTLLAQDNVDAAIAQFQQGLTAMPDYGKLLQAMNQALLRRDAQSMYDEAVLNVGAGKHEEARRLLLRLRENFPDHKRAAELLAKIDAETEEEESASRLVLSSKAPITLNFRQTDQRAAFEFLARSFGVDIIFDESMRNTPVTLYAKDVTFEQALSLMLATTKTFYKKVGPNTILLAADTREKRGQYEDQIVRTFQLSNMRAKEMADILRGLISIRKVIVNEPLNTLVLRDSEDVIRLAARIIETNDRQAAELILEVEILEVNRTKAERLGLDFGAYRISANPGSTGIPVTGSIRQSIRSSATLTLPSASFNFYKQDVDAKTLANPKVRVLSGKSAKIHIGDRVPLRAATIQDATGQVRTTYDYKEIGIRLQAEPIVHIDNTVTVKVGLEVSTLGENLGSATEPAYKIGTRNAETHMTLRDGETAILGGLIRDEDRRTRAKVPLLGDIPAVGSLFTSYDDSGGRTDVLLTITPRVVRGWDHLPSASRSFVSGSEDRYMNEPLFASLQRRAVKKPGAPVATDAAPVATATGVAPAAVAGAEAPATAGVTVTAAALPAEVPPPAVAKPPLLAFSEQAYSVENGKEFEVVLVGDNIAGARQVPVEILLNAHILKLVRVDAGAHSDGAPAAEMDEARGLLKLTVAVKPGEADRKQLARIVLRGDRPGISYLVHRTLPIDTGSSAPVTPQVRVSRVLVK